MTAPDLQVTARRCERCGSHPADTVLCGHGLLCDRCLDASSSAPPPEQPP